MGLKDDLKYFHNKEWDMKTSNNSKIEEIRIKYKYKELILKNKIKINRTIASKIVGPDCAYHIYNLDYKKVEKKKK